MSGSSTPFDDGGDLRDPALHQALDHAPDRDAAPDPRTRDAILKAARNLATAPVNASPAANTASPRSWWRRLFGGGKPSARMPWNAAFATVLVAAFVTVLWYREPVPEARLDGEARVGEVAAPARRPAPAQHSAKAVSAEPPAAATPPVGAAQVPGAESAAPVEPTGAAARSPEPAVVAEPSAPLPVVRDERREGRVEGGRRRTDAAGAPAVKASPLPAAPSAPPYRGLQQGAAPAAAGTSEDRVGGIVSGGPSSRTPNTAAKASMVHGMASFSALERWTSLSFTRAGASVRHERSDIEGLPALVSSVARSATTSDDALTAPVDARLELYQGNVRIAALEIAGSQVRWTSQPGGAAWVGTPPASALEALRSLLMR